MKPSRFSVGCFLIAVVLAGGRPSPARSEELPGTAWRTVAVLRDAEMALVAFRADPMHDAAAEEIERLAQWVAEGRESLSARNVSGASRIAERVALQIVCVKAVLETARIRQELAAERQRLAELKSRRDALIAATSGASGMAP